MVIVYVVLTEGVKAFSAARDNYKQMRQVFDDPAMRKLVSGDLDDAGKFITSGQVSGAKVRNLKKALGPEGEEEVRKVGFNVIYNLVGDSMDGGKLNARQLARAWDHIPVSTRNELFTTRFTLEGRTVTDNELANAVKDTLTKIGRQDMARNFAIVARPILGAATGGYIGGRFGHAVLGAIAGAVLEGRPTEAQSLLEQVLTDPG